MRVRALSIILHVSLSTSAVLYASVWQYELTCLHELYSVTSLFVSMTIGFLIRDCAFFCRTAFHGDWNNTCEENPSTCVHALAVNKLIDPSNGAFSCLVARFVSERGNTCDDGLKLPLCFIPLLLFFFFLLPLSATMTNNPFYFTHFNEEMWMWPQSPCSIKSAQYTAVVSRQSQWAQMYRHGFASAVSCASP